MPKQIVCALLTGLLASSEGANPRFTCESWCGVNRPWEEHCAWDQCIACEECCSISASSGSSTFDVGLHPEHYVHPNFVSFTMDTYYLSRLGPGAWIDDHRSGYDHIDLKDPQNIALARAIGPSFLRIGGTTSDNITYDMSTPSEDPPYVPSSRGSDVGEIIPHGTLVAADWDAINEFAQAAQWEIVFGLNVFDGWEHGTRTWDPTRSIALMNYTRVMGYPVVGWELGNEPDISKKDLQTSELAASFDAFFREVGKVYDATGGGTSSAPWLIGLDVTQGSSDFLNNTLAGMQHPVVDIVTWHHYFVAWWKDEVPPCSFARIDLLNEYRQYADAMAEVYESYSARRGPQTTQLWMGETSGAGGSWVDQVHGTFIGIFWYADKLGSAAATGHSVVVRQSWMEARGDIVGHGPAPEFWLALLWKRLVGQGVLPVTMSSGTTSTRCYMHCSSDGSATAIVINLGNSTEQVTLNLGVSRVVISEYHLTSWPSAGDLWSTDLAINGQKASLTQAGHIPEFPPQKNWHKFNPNVTLSALSVALAVFPAGSVPKCTGDSILV